MTTKPIFIAGLLLVTLTRAAETAPVVFHSFTYTGRDTIFEQSLPPGHYRNPILAGCYPDPSICRVGDDYYLVNSTFSYFPGIPIFHSRDLVNWTQLGHVIDRPAQLKYSGLGVTRGIFAPSLKYHNGVFYLTCTMVDSGGNFLVTATNPAGPWSDPVWLDFEGIDPTLFFDDDGRAWMINNGSPAGPPLYQGHRAIWIQEFNLATKKLMGSRKLILNGGVDLAKKPVWIEGPHIFKRNGWYYLCCAEGGTSLEHSQVVLRSKSVLGPFVPWEKNPILTQRDLDGTAPNAVTCTGHAELVIGPDGNWWSAFLGCRPFAGQYWTTGRETFLLPVKWTDDGWPVILPPGERVPYVVASPGRAYRAEATVSHPPDEPSDEAARQRRLALPVGSASLTGNFTWHDDFSKPALDFAWFMLRTPAENWWSISKDSLALTPRADRLSDKGNPSFLARRVQHAKFDASAKLDVPVTAGVSAGLAIFQNETHHYYFAAQRTAEGLKVFVEKWNGPKAERIFSGALPETKELELRIAGDEKILSFAYALQPGEWKVVVPDADALAITVQAAGGGNHFTGAVIGPHARLEVQ
jgi:xylan 1,4-beta-xylosidase